MKENTRGTKRGDNMSKPEKDDWLSFLKKASKPLALGGTLLVISSMALAGAVIGLSVSAPFLLLLNLVLLPVLLTGGVVFTGLMTSAAGLGATGYWVYSFAKGERPLGAEKLLCLIWRVKKAIKVLVRSPRANDDAAAA